MGIFSHQNLYSSKYINAEITDAGGRIWVFHLRYVLGDYFLVTMEGQTYAFRIEGKRIKTYHHFFMRTVRKLYYDTSHYMPLSPEDLKALELMVIKNGLPKMNRRLFDILKYLGKTERPDFKEHNMNDLFAVVASQESQYYEESQNMKNFLKHLNLEKIVTPIKEITEFIEEDLIATDPQFLGDTLPHYQRVDAENKKVTNTPVKGKGPFLKIMIICLIIAAIAIAILWIISTGQLNNLGGLIQLPGATSTQDVMSQYGSPEQLKVAIDAGRVDYQSLPSEIKKLVDAVKPPPQVIQITP